MRFALQPPVPHPAARLTPAITTVLLSSDLVIVSSSSSSMASQSKQKTTGPRKQIDFIVTTANPSDVSTSKANKKRVRSVAALKSWPERRKKMFQDLENTRTGHGAFLIDRSVLEPQSTNEEIGNNVVSRPWPERRTKTFQQGEGSSSTQYHDAPLFERPEQQIQWRQPISQPPLLISGPSDLTIPRVPPGFTDASPRYLPYGAIPDRTTPRRDYHHIQSGDAGYSSSQAAGSSISMYQSAANQLLSSLRSESATHPFGSTHVPWNSSNNNYQHRPAGESSKKKRMADGVDKDSRHGSGSMLLLTPPTSPQLDAARGRADPFNCYTVEWQPWFDQILHHMMTVYAPRGWPALRISQEQGVKWEWFLTQNALCEPALFYVRLLFGSGDLIRLGGLPQKYMFWLRSQAIQAINEALGDPRRACSDALILAVGRIAMHEHMYGDREMSVAIHRPAQKRMVDMRGGMGVLGFPEIVKRMMRWSDQVMAVGTGTETMLGEDVKNPNFTLRESVSAIEKWAPQEMQRVRTKVKVEDILNEEKEIGR